MPTRSGELHGKRIDRPFGSGDAWEGIRDAAIVQIQERLAITFDQDGRVPVELRVVQIELELPSRDGNLALVWASDDSRAPVSRERIGECGSPKFRDDQCEIPRLQAVEKRQVEVILVLVTHVQESLLARRSQLLLHERREVVVLRKLEP
jgi:hypothetical protein